MEKFINDYNLLFNVPNYRINKNTCEQFRKECPNLFKNPEWSLDRHRKRLMDWLLSKNPEELKALK